MHSGGIELVERGERRKLFVKLVERFPLVLAGVDEHRNEVADLTKFTRRIVEEWTTGERQRTHKAVAERIMDHRRASARRMIPNLLFGFEDAHSRMPGKRSGRGETRDPAADDDYVGRGHAAVSRSLTILPPWVRRMAFTISSSSGRTGAPCSLSQKALRKL